MKLVIYTQYKENYAAHDWDGEGQCPQHWKFKGGDTYIVEGLQYTQDFEQKFLDKLIGMIAYKNNYSEEYVLEFKSAADDEKIFDFWKAPKIITMQGDNFVVSSVAKNDEYGYMNQKIAEKRDSYIMLAEGKRDNYQSSYTLKDGRVVSYEQLSECLT